MRILYVVGTRPNIVKMAPVLRALQRRLPDASHVLVHTGQHYDHSMFEALREDLRVPAPAHELSVGSGTHAQQTALTMSRLEPVIVGERPDLVVVAGDVNATLAAALTAAQLGVPVAHVESGLRSFDRTMAEERNRVLTDQLADLLFAHCADAVRNLEREGIDRGRIFLVGNTMIDSLIATEPQFSASGMASRLGLDEHGYLLVTLHRPALVDGPLLASAVAELRQVSQRLPVVFPVHPRTRRMLGDVASGPAVRLLDPLGYIEFCSLLADARAVLTDSGGVQEESTYLGIPCFTLRDNTERPVTISDGTNVLLGLDPVGIRDLLPRLDRIAPAPASPPPLWDGHAGERIAGVIARWLRSAEARPEVLQPSR